MHHIKKLGLLAISLTCLLVLGVVGTASATELYKYTAPNPNDTLGAGTSIKASMTAGYSMRRQETTGWVTDTCTEWGLEGTITTPGGEASHPVISLSSNNIGKCVNAMKFLKPGELEIRHVVGSTNGDVYLKNAEVTYVDTGSLLDCIVKIEGATLLGRLTGGVFGVPTLDVKWQLPAVGWCEDKEVLGTLTITSPTGLVVEAK